MADRRVGPRIGQTTAEAHALSRVDAVKNAMGMSNYSTKAFIDVIKGEMAAARLFDDRRASDLDVHNLKSRLHALGGPWGDTNDEAVLRGRLAARLRLHDELRPWIV